LTVTSANALSNRYNVVVDGILTNDAQTVEKYDEVITIAADKTAPTIVSTSKPSAGTVKVVFSEPISTLGNVDYKLADGTVVSINPTGVQNNFVPGAKEVTFTLGSEVAAGKTAIATFIGAQDQAGNLLSPNPATVSLYKGAADGVAPTVSSITQTGAKSYSVKFSEELSTVTANTLFAIAGNTTVSVTKDSTDPTKYNVVTTNALDDLTTISIDAVADLSGETTAATTKVFNFVKDGVAPKVTSSAVVVDATDKKEYLEVTFDKDVELSTANVDATAGTSSKDYVTTTLVDTDIAPQTVTYKNASSKKVVRVDLATFLGAKDVEGATYSLDLAFAGVTSGAGVAADTAKTTFTRGKDGTAGSVAVATAESIAQEATNNSKLDVTFDMAVDGASATNPANYKVDGAVVESVTLLSVDGGTGKQVAVLNLKADSNGFTGTRNINISNVKALGSSKVMTPFFTNSVIIKENVAPKVTSAKLTATDTVTLTFSEKVTSGAFLDFEVLVGNLAQSTVDTRNAVVTDATTAIITVNSIDATELAKGISLKALSTLDITDAAGNKVSVPSNIAVTQ
jgi:hypothetical protein